jgi:protocatechuate 3,4-dioxygenase beta subunit
MNLIEGNNTLNVSLTPIAAATSTLTGFVTDSVTGLPLEGVAVHIDNMTAYTDASGGYGFTGLEPGSYGIGFSKTGYISVTR